MSTQGLLLLIIIAIFVVSAAVQKIKQRRREAERIAKFKADLAALKERLENIDIVLNKADAALNNARALSKDIDASIKLEEWKDKGGE